MGGKEKKRGSLEGEKKNVLTVFRFFLWLLPLFVHAVRERFHPFPLAHHIIPGIVPQDFWYWQYVYYRDTTKEVCVCVCVLFVFPC